MPQVDRKDLDGYIRASRAPFEQHLKTLVEIPSVSMDPAHAGDVVRCAEAAARIVRELGGEARVEKTAGTPVVTGLFRSRASGKRPCVTVYNHLDVQPGGGPPDWKREPFVFSKEGDRYFARGATDDKGPALTALFAAAYAQERGLPIDVRFLWETEEEIGSPNFASWLRGRAKEIPTDSVVVSDTIWVARGQPALSSGLRGLQAAVLRLETGTKDTHSGLTGGAARNPIAELCHIVSQCVDAKTGRVKIPGFYDDVVRATQREVQSFKKSGFSVQKFKKAHGLKKLRSEDPARVMKAIWAEPTFEVHGIAGGYQGPGVKTAVPPRAELKVSMRLVPDQKPAKVLKLLKDHVKRLNPDVRVIGESGLEPYRGSTDDACFRAAAEAVRWAFGKDPAVVREGGSIGAIVTMKKHLKCPVAFIGLSLPEHGYHAPNEFFDWGQASGGMRAFVKYFELLAAGER